LCSNFIDGYCRLYNLNLKNSNGHYYKGREGVSFRLLVFILKEEFNVTFRQIGAITKRSHQDISYHYNQVIEHGFLKAEAERRFYLVRSIYTGESG